jgi:hypothetical protein
MPDGRPGTNAGKSGPPRAKSSRLPLGDLRPRPGDPDLRPGTRRDNDGRGNRGHRSRDPRRRAEPFYPGSQSGTTRWRGATVKEGKGLPTDLRFRGPRGGPTPRPGRRRHPNCSARGATNAYGVRPGTSLDRPSCDVERLNGNRRIRKYARWCVDGGLAAPSHSIPDQGTTIELQMMIRPRFFSTSYEPVMEDPGPHARRRFDAPMS